MEAHSGTKMEAHSGTKMEAHVTPVCQGVLKSWTRTPEAPGEQFLAPGEQFLTPPWNFNKP